MTNRKTKSELEAMTSQELAKYEEIVAKALRQSGNEPSLLAHLFDVNNSKKSAAIKEAEKGKKTASDTRAAKVTDAHQTANALRRECSTDPGHKMAVHLCELLTELLPA